jgi:hypothetical protein
MVLFGMHVPLSILVRSADARQGSTEIGVSPGTTPPSGPLARRLALETET